MLSEVSVGESDKKPQKYRSNFSDLREQIFKIVFSDTSASLADYVLDANFILSFPVSNQFYAAVLQH